MSLVPKNEFSAKGGKNKPMTPAQREAFRLVWLQMLERKSLEPIWNRAMTDEARVVAVCSEILQAEFKGMEFKWYKEFKMVKKLQAEKEDLLAQLKAQETVSAQKAAFDKAWTAAEAAVEQQMEVEKDLEWVEDPEESAVDKDTPSAKDIHQGGLNVSSEGMLETETPESESANAVESTDGDKVHLNVLSLTELERERNMTFSSSEEDSDGESMTEEDLLLENAETQLPMPLAQSTQLPQTVCKTKVEGKWDFDESDYKAKLRKRKDVNYAEVESQMESEAKIPKRDEILPVHHESQVDKKECQPDMNLTNLVSDPPDWSDERRLLQNSYEPETSDYLGVEAHSQLPNVEFPDMD